jgi:Tfp pilus assembly PilM family ATPase
MSSLPDLLLPKVKFFGLSIERNAIHVIELAKGNTPPKLGTVRLPEHAFVDGVISDVPTFVKAVRDLLIAAGITTPYVAVTFS